MSRSNPTENGTPNPAVRWFEWNGEVGTVRYYDKDEKKNVDVGADFTFLLLDQLGSVRGWHEASESGIYSNEVKDTRQDALIVRSFKAGTLVEGLYKDIKDRANTLGGQFVTNCYIAFKHNGALAIGSIRFKGATLGAWMEFCKANRVQLFKKAVRINGFAEGKKGRIVYRTPTFQLVDVGDDTNAAAIGLDATLQDFLKVYLRRNTRDQAEQVAPHLRDEDVDTDQREVERAGYSAPLTDDDIPF
jgi:hypothetical protein